MICEEHNRASISHQPHWPLASWVVVLTSLICTSIPSPLLGGYVFLGVGNDGYYDDVCALWDALQVQPGWAGAVHQLWSNRTGAQIARDISWFERAGPGDVAIWYYSGHGGSYINDADGDERSGSAGNRWDESIDRLGFGNAATDDQIADAFARINPLVPVVTIMDTCHAGGFVGGADDLNKLGNVVALLSCRENQNSYGDRQYSLFTAGLIAGLAPHLPADADRNGVLCADEWFNYAIALIPSGYPQNPVYWAAPGLEQVPIAVPEPAAIGFLALGAFVLRRLSALHGCVTRGVRQRHRSGLAVRAKEQPASQQIDLLRRGANVNSESAFHRP